MKPYLTLLIVVALCLLLPISAAAHGVELTYLQGREMEIQARYDNGRPMQGAQVEVFAPDDPTTPWLKGNCDSDGLFRFSPDGRKPGQWDVRVRLDGHGGIIRIPVQRATLTIAGLSLWQVFGTIAAMIIGYYAMHLFVFVRVKQSKS